MGGFGLKFNDGDGWKRRSKETFSEVGGVKLYFALGWHGKVRRKEEGFG